MYPLKVLLVEASLELIPNEIIDDKFIVNIAKKRGKKPENMILDKAIHYFAMKKLKMKEKRGRPDILHICLIEALDSPLNLNGLLRIYIHTINDVMISILPKTRIPRNYNNFIGLMEQLFKIGYVPPKGKKLIKIEGVMKIDKILNKINSSYTILLSERGKRESIENIVIKAFEENAVLLIGGFAAGDFTKEVYELANEVMSIYNRPLTSNIVMSRILCAYERFCKILI